MTAEETFLEDVRRRLGEEALDESDETIRRFGANRLPGGDRAVRAVVRPASSEEVQALVRLANEHRVALYPTSTGENAGLGLRSPLRPDRIVVDVGARMNRIREIDETLCFAEIEPGVSYRALHAALVDAGDRLMMDTTSGPPEGGIVGNTLDKGAGYTPYFDHFGMSCGLEVVLGDGSLLRTADGALPGSRTWHIAKYGYGPFLDGLFVQSNFGIVTRLGVWLMPRPPVVRCFFFVFPDDEDFAEIIEITRALKLANAVPSLIKVTNDLYAIGSERSYPFERTGGRTPLPGPVRRELQQEHGIGAWCVSGAFYGASEEALEAPLERVRARFEASGKGRYIAHEEASESPMLSIHIATFAGRPTERELGLLDWRPGGGACWFLPATPMIGKIADQHQEMSRRILAEHGLEYVAEYVCGPRISRALHLLLFDREDPDARRRTAEAYEALADAYARAGYPVSRAPLDFQGSAMDRLQVFPEVCGRIKRALDPNGVLAPGRYGIR